MASVVLSGDTSGSITVAAPAVAGSNTQTLPAVSGTIVVGSAAVSAAGQIPFSTDGATFTPTAKIVSGTSVTASGAAVEFTGLPSWVKRITVSLSNVSTDGSSNYIVQLGTASTTWTTTGYLGSSANITASAGSLITGGLALSQNVAAASVANGVMTINLISATSNTWASNSVLGFSNSAAVQVGGSSVALAATLTAIRVTTVGGVNTFDAGTINILYE